MLENQSKWSRFLANRKYWVDDLSESLLCDILFQVVGNTCFYGRSYMTFRLDLKTNSKSLHTLW